MIEKNKFNFNYKLSFSKNYNFNSSLFLIFLNLKIKKTIVLLLKNNLTLKILFYKNFYNFYKFFLARVILTVGRKLNYTTTAVYKKFAVKKNVLNIKKVFFSVNPVSIKIKNQNLKPNIYFFLKNNFFFNTINYCVLRKLKKNKQLKNLFFLRVFGSDLKTNFNYLFKNLRTLFYTKLFNFSLSLIKKIDVAAYINTYRLNTSKNVEIDYIKILFFTQVNTSFFFMDFFINYHLINHIFTIKKIKTKCKFKLNLIFFLNYLMFIKDKNIFNNLKNNYNFISNNFLKNFFNFFDYNSNNLKFDDNIKKKLVVFNNYYPLFLSSKITYKKFFSFIKNNHNLDYIVFTNKFVISFLEKNFKKNFFIKYTNNYYNKINNYYLDSIINDYKNFQPAYWKKFLVKDFIKILWYSFFLKDLSMISEWISIFMESLHFKNHKKFLSFLSNFIEKYSGVFIDVLNIKGFFFDIRGKVGVTGSSKKRHFFFKFGSVNKSSKKTKINISQNLVRTYSGVLGLTYIINF